MINIKYFLEILVIFYVLKQIFMIFFWIKICLIILKNLIKKIFNKNLIFIVLK